MTCKVTECFKKHSGIITERSVAYSLPVEFACRSQASINRRCGTFCRLPFDSLSFNIPNSHFRISLVTLYVKWHGRTSPSRSHIQTQYTRFAPSSLFILYQFTSPFFIFSLSHSYTHTQVLVCPFVCISACVCMPLSASIKTKTAKKRVFLFYVRCVSVVCLHFNRLALLSHYLFNCILFGSWVAPCIRTLDFICAHAIQSYIQNIRVRMCHCQTSTRSTQSKHSSSHRFAINCGRPGNNHLPIWTDSSHA